MSAPLLTARALVPELPGLAPPPLDLTLDRPGITFVLGPHTPVRDAWLRTLAGLDAPRSGELLLLGRPTAGLDRRAELRLRQEAAFVLREAPLLSVLNGLQNLLLPAVYHGRGSPQEMERKGRALLERLGVECDLTVLPAWLGEWERRALAIARALMLEPKLLFLEEPARGLEETGRRSLRGLIERVAREEGIAVMMSVANPHLLRELADRILFVAPGKLWLFDDWAAMVRDAPEEIRGQLPV